MEQNKHALVDSNPEEGAAKKIKLENPVVENPQRKPEEPNPRPKGIQEDDVGITEYISKANNGFSGILKQRYYDFLVNEIDLDGNVVHLTDEGIQNRKERRKEKKIIEKQIKNEDGDHSTTTIPKENEDGEQSATAKEPEEEKPQLNLKPENRIALLELIGEEDLTKIEELLIAGGEMETSKVFDDKSERGKIHQLLRSAFENKLDSLTTDSNTLKVKLALRRSRNNRNRIPKENKNGNDSNDGDFGIGPVKNYLRLTVYKENKETMEVAALLCKFLRIPSKNMGYAGTKDRRGVTVQRLSIEKMRVNRVNNLNRILKGIRIGSFSYSDERLGLGDLKGNEFLITIKDVEHYDKTKKLEEVLKESFDSLKEFGFINYYGMQRFGTFSISTHVVGIQLLLGKWKEAAELLLSEQELVTPESIEARKIWAETRNPTLTLSKMPRRCNAEFAILEALAKDKQTEDKSYSDHSYYGAIMRIPRNLRIMYGHAYQSYVWNCVASKRIELFGLQIVEGDLVIDQESASNSKDIIAEDEEDVKDPKFVKARAVTSEEIASNTFSIYDVVLPTPGFDVVYPSNPTLKKVYEEVMAKDGLEPYNMTRKVREFSLSGSYRKLMGRATDLEYFTRKYNFNDETLVKTDLDILKANQAFQKVEIDKILEAKDNLSEEELEKQIEAIRNLKEFPHVKQIEDGDENGTKTAVIIRMKLGVSAYATMALRELMKKDTSRTGDMCNVVEEEAKN